MRKWIATRYEVSIHALVRGRLLVPAVGSILFAVSIHALVRGRPDTQPDGDRSILVVSIHALVRGRRGDSE